MKALEQSDQLWYRADRDYQGLGQGRRALLAALATAPDYKWATMPQYEVPSGSGSE